MPTVAINRVGLLKKGHASIKIHFIALVQTHLYNSGTLTTRVAAHNIRA